MLDLHFKKWPCKQTLQGKMETYSEKLHFSDFIQFASGALAWCHPSIVKFNHDVSLACHFPKMFACKTFAGLSRKQLTLSNEETEIQNMQLGVLIVHKSAAVSGRCQETQMAHCRMSRLVCCFCGRSCWSPNKLYSFSFHFFGESCLLTRIYDLILRSLACVLHFKKFFLVFS